MPNRRLSGERANASTKRRNFRQRYDDLETQRAALVARLNSLRETSHAHPGYNRALTLLNSTFRKVKLAQRLTVLQAASFLIDVLEHITFVV